MSIGMRYFDLTRRNKRGQQTSVLACGREESGRARAWQGGRGWHWALVLAGHVGGGRLLADHGHAVVIPLAHTGRLGDALLEGVLALVREAHPHWSGRSRSTTNGVEQPARKFVKSGIKRDILLEKATTAASKQTSATVLHTECLSRAYLILSSLILSARLYLRHIILRRPRVGLEHTRDETLVG